MSNALDSRLRAALQELAQDGQPVNLADAALRGAVRRRRTRYAVAVSATAVVVALTALTAANLLRTGHSQPAAGRTGGQVVSSYRVGGAPETYLLDPATGRYRKTSYSWAVVSPDARSAAVLPGLGPEGKPAVTRLGILDLGSQVVRWFTTPEPVWAPVWSPDGDMVLATVVPVEGIGSGPSKGFLRLDVASAELTSTPVTGRPSAAGPFLWGPDGTTVIGSTTVSTPAAVDGGPGGPTVYDLAGRELRHLAVPGNALTLDPWSPSGRLLVLDGEAAGGRPEQLIVNATTGQLVGRVDTPYPALGWRDDTHLLVRTDEGAVQSVDVASGNRRSVGRLPQRDVDDVFVTSADDLLRQARQNAF